MADNVTVSNSPTSVNTDIPVRTLDKAGEQTQVVAIDWSGSGTEDLTSPDFATETTLQSINAAIAGGLYFNITTNSDILGVGVTGRRNNEIEISFFDSFDTNLITNTTAAGGSATISGGHARYRTGTNINGAARGQSVYNCQYRPAHEEYAFFTAAFTTGVANSFQRIGIYDANNGAFIGYEGTSFGVTLRSGSVDTTIARANWNGDPLDGSVGSIFTRAGTPEAINLTYSNLYRIRFAWLGSASFIFEVFSPDAKWITFHTIRIPNSQLAPSIQTPNLPMQIECVKTADGSADLSIYTACWAAGTTSDYNPITETLTDYSLANLTRAVIAGRSSTGGGTYYNVKVNPSGSLITAIGDISGVVGQNTMANSLPVVIASNQTAVPVSDNGGSITVDGTVAATQSGTWNINNISGTISLPTGAATAAKQPALGTAGTASADVITVQGIASMTALKVDGSAVTQPISGTVTANAGTGTFAISAASLPLPTGAATESTLSTLNGKVTACNTGAVTISTALPTGTNNIGDVDVLTLPNVTLASQANPFTSAIPISDNAGSITVDGTVAATQSGTWNITNISGTISLPTGAATESTLSTLNGKVTACNTGAVTISAALPAGTNNIGDVDIVSLPSVVAATYSTSSVTSVTSAAVSTSILASNANRRMAIMVNDTDKNVYIKLGATASTTSFSYKLTPGQTLELPMPVYTGAIDAIWDSSPTGSMRVTEIT